MARGRKAVERNSELPASPTDRELFDSLINEAVGYKRDIDRLRNQIKGVMESLTHSDSKLRLDRKYATKMINVRYNEFKIKTQVAELQTALDDTGVLTGASKQEG